MVSKTASQHLADRSPPFDVDLPLGHLVGKLGKLVLLLPQREVLVVLGAGVAECVMQEAPPAGQGGGRHINDICNICFWFYFYRVSKINASQERGGN